MGAKQVTSFIEQNSSKLSPQIETLLSLWCKCELSREASLSDYEFEFKYPEAHTDRSEKLAAQSQNIIRLLCDLKVQSSWDVAAKLLVWRGTLAPYVEDFSQFTDAEKLGFTACDEFLAVLSAAPAENFGASAAL